MRYEDLKTTAHLILEDRHLSHRCWDNSSAYIDYVAGTFFVPRPTTDDCECVRRYLTKLCCTFGWTEVSVTVHPKSNTIGYILSKGPVIRSDNARMPA